jgi:hypothetical protein
LEFVSDFIYIRKRLEEETIEIASKKSQSLKKRSENENEKDPVVSIERICTGM